MEDEDDGLCYLGSSNENFKKTRINKGARSF